MRLALAAILALCAAPAAAQDFSYGAALFRDHCAACHGAQGRGDGPVADALVVAPRDLTGLAEAAGGFPFSAVYQAIDGRRDIAAHGSREMPVWGDLFRAEALPRTMHPGVEAEEIVQARLLALVYFLQTVQR